MKRKYQLKLVKHEIWQHKKISNCMRNFQIILKQFYNYYLIILKKKYVLLLES